MEIILYFDWNIKMQGKIIKFIFNLNGFYFRNGNICECLLKNIGLIYFDLVIFDLLFAKRREYAFI